MNTTQTFLFALVGGLIACLMASAPASAFQTSCRVQIVDEESGWPVPLVELRTIHDVRFVSDNGGNIAFDLPELMNVETWFFVEGHGYEVPKDGFGFQGVRLKPEPGKTLTVKVKRLLPAKRLGRITGAGIFGESQKLGLETDWKEQGLLGCDSVQIAVHQGKRYWAWGDTNLPHYPLGLFHMSSATTEVKPLAEFKPPIRLRYEYFRDEKQRPRSVAEMPGQGPTWISGYVSLPDKQGQNHLVATYVKVVAPMTVYECGLCVWNDESQKFEQLKVLWSKSEDSNAPPLMPDGHPTFWKDDAGVEWLLFGDPFPRLKCHATFEDWQDPTKWMQLEPQTTVLAKAGETSIQPHRGSIAWNEYRKKWVTIFTQVGGDSSYLGEIWFAESDSPLGPWEDAIKVVTHDHYSFYNPRLHADFTDSNSPILLFEATYTRLFSATQAGTPRYNYNQILYRLDLDELDSD